MGMCILASLSEALVQLRGRQNVRSYLVGSIADCADGFVPGAEVANNSLC